MSHHRRAVTAPGAPEAVGPYSHAVVSGGLLFCSGQVALDPASGELVGDTPAEQATQCLQNLTAVCEAAGAQLADAVRCTVLLTDIGAFADVNEAYGASSRTASRRRASPTPSSRCPRARRSRSTAVVALTD
jgi:2-iminobutanoate/2-iminopropanoate deaminase